MTYRGIEFNGTTYSNAEMVLTCNFDNTKKLWKQEKLLVLVQVLDGTSKFKLVVSGVTTAYYTPDSNGYVIVDLSDIARTYDPIPTITASIDGGVESPVVSLLNKGVQGLINPESVIIPYHPLQEYGVIIAPPSIMYKTGAVQHFEFQDDGTYTWYKRDSDGWGEITNTSPYVNFNTNMLRLAKGSTSDVVYERVLKKEICDHRYALVKWISFTGATREHLWEVKKNTIAQADTISLLTMDNSYNDIRGREDGFTIALDGLNAYDYWYYADVITSSDVRVSFDGGSTYTQVQVTTKSVTIPDGNAIDGKLEISVNWKRYDAVAL